MRARRLLPALLVVVVACSGPIPEQPAATPFEAPAELTVYDTEDMAAGQTVYVPVYSHVYQDSRRRQLESVATLSIRNTDLTHPIRVNSIRYYSSQELLAAAALSGAAGGNRSGGGRAR